MGQSWSVLGRFWGLLFGSSISRSRVSALCAERRDVRREIAPTGSDDDSACGWEAIAREPLAEEVAELSDTLECLMLGLDAKQQQILVLRLQGCTVPEISADVGRTERTVHRVLAQVREALKRLEGEPA